MAPKMSVVRKLLLGSPASFKQQRKSEAARSSTPYKICSSRKATNLPPKPTRHRAKRLEAANQLPLSRSVSALQIDDFPTPSNPSMTLKRPLILKHPPVSSD